MRRNEACRILTGIASSELISDTASKQIFKARDIVVCEPNEILDVLATPEQREESKKVLCQYLNRIIDDSMFDGELRSGLYDIVLSINMDNWQSCDSMYIPIRCKNCPLFKEGSNET